MSYEDLLLFFKANEFDFVISVGASSAPDRGFLEALPKDATPLESAAHRAQAEKMGYK